MPRAAINDTPGGVELLFQEGGIIVARDRAFTTLAERHAFLERARQLTKAQDPSYFAAARTDRHRPAERQT
jgi:hypothetical protein